MTARVEGEVYELDPRKGESSEDLRFVMREMKHFVNWLDGRIKKLEECTAVLPTLEKSHGTIDDVNREYHERVELKIDRVTAKMTELLAKMDVDNTAQNGAVTGSQLDTDYSDIDSDL